MPSHSNKKIKKHVEDSKELVDKMQKLTSTLQETLQKNFEDSMGVPLPTIMGAIVRQTDTAMVYSTDPSVDEYINGARKLLGAALGGEKLEIINGMLDIVDVVATKIIGKGDVKTGIHSTSARTGDYITAAFSVVQMATAKDWATEANFFVSYYAFVVFQPHMTQTSMLSRRPMLRAAMAELGAAPTVNVKEVATSNYTYTPL